MRDAHNLFIIFRRLIWYHDFPNVFHLYNLAICHIINASYPNTHFSSDAHTFIYTHSICLVIIKEIFHPFTFQLKSCFLVFVLKVNISWLIHMLTAEIKTIVFSLDTAVNEHAHEVSCSLHGLHCCQLKFIFY